MAQSLGHQATLAMDPVTPVDTSSEPYEFISESVTRSQELLKTNGLTGTIQRHANRSRQGLERVGGDIVMNVCPYDLDLILPRILGAAESVDVFDLAETIPTFVMMIDRGADAALYEGCYISKAVFRGSSGQMITMTLSILAKTETTGQTFPSLTLDVTAASAPFVMSDGVLTLQSSARQFNSFELTIDNQLEADFRNSTTATDIDRSNHILVTLAAEVPWISANTDLYEEALAGATGDITFTNGAVSTKFEFGTLQPSPDQGPVTGGPGRIPLNIVLDAAKDSSNAFVIKVTNDAAP